jgi:hypothetical protein
MAWILNAATGIFRRSQTTNTDKPEFLAGGETDEKIASAASALFEGVEKKIIDEDDRFSPLSDDGINDDPTAPAIDALYEKAAKVASANEGSSGLSASSSPGFSDLEDDEVANILRPLNPSEGFQTAEAQMPQPPEFVLEDQKYRDEFEELTLGQDVAEKDYLKKLYLHYREIYKEHVEGTEESDPTITTEDLFKAVQVLLEVDEAGLDDEQRANLLNIVVLNNLRYKTKIENLTPGNLSRREDILEKGQIHLRSYYENAFKLFNSQRDLFKYVILTQFSNSSLQVFQQEVLRDMKLNSAEEFNKARNETYLEIIYLVIKKAQEEKKLSDNLIANIEKVKTILKEHTDGSKEIIDYLRTYTSAETQGYFEDALKELVSLRPTFKVQLSDRFYGSEKITIQKEPTSSQEQLFNAQQMEVASLIESLSRYQGLLDDSIQFIDSTLNEVKEKTKAERQKKLAPKLELTPAKPPIDNSPDQNRIKIKRKLVESFENIKIEMKKEKPNNDLLFQSAISKTLKDKKIFNIDKIELHKLSVDELIDYISSFYSNLLSVSNEKLAIEKLKSAVQKILSEKSIPTLKKLILDLMKFLEMDENKTAKDSKYGKQILDLIKLLLGYKNELTKACK